MKQDKKFVSQLSQVKVAVLEKRLKFSTFWR